MERKASGRAATGSRAAATTMHALTRLIRVKFQASWPTAGA